MTPGHPYPYLYWKPKTRAERKAAKNRKWKRRAEKLEICADNLENWSKKQTQKVKRMDKNTKEWSERTNRKIRDFNDRIMSRLFREK